jgi:hypothetical protein
MSVFRGFALFWAGNAMAHDYVAVTIVLLVAVAVSALDFKVDNRGT